MLSVIIRRKQTTLGLNTQISLRGLPASFLCYGAADLQRLAITWIMDQADEDIPIIIIGGGPSGLTLGYMLAKLGGI